VRLGSVSSRFRIAFGDDARRGITLLFENTR
jgi:hypothetical protein